MCIRDSSVREVARAVAVGVAVLVGARGRTRNDGNDSYTHLTLPTKRLVVLMVVPVSLNNNTHQPATLFTMLDN